MACTQLKDKATMIWKNRKHPVKTAGESFLAQAA